jgi:peptidyl-prolyl cis-trans isomerase A (cyclophilin A)
MKVVIRAHFAAVVMLAAAVSVAAGQQSTPASPATKPGDDPAASQTAKPATPATEELPDGPTPQPSALIHPNGPMVLFDTSMGRITCQFYQKQAPKTVANFIALATGTKDWTDPVSNKKMHNQPLYNGTTFHRVIPGFMIQGGDPAGNGSGTPGYEFRNEASPDLLFDKPGRLAYANSGPNTNGSQFFITEVATPHLNGGYTIFGQCDDAAVELVKQIAHMARDPSNDKPFRTVKIIHIRIVRGSSATPAKPAGANVKKPAAAAPGNPN